MEFKKWYPQYYVLEQGDVMDLLTERQRYGLQNLFDTIQRRRGRLGKKDNTYIVVDDDAPYAWVIWKLIDLSLTDPEGLKILLSNLGEEEHFDIKRWTKKYRDPGTDRVWP